MEAYNIAKTPSKYANVNISCQMLICVACKMLSNVNLRCL